MEVSVRTGDTLSYYGSLLKIPVKLIEDSNPEVDPQNMKAAEKVYLPGYVAVPYTIKEGDTLSRIAASKELAQDAIHLLNQTIDEYQLTPGETLYVPEKMTVPIIRTDTPLDYKRLVKVIHHLKKVYPFMSVTTIGSSVQGNFLHEMRIGRGKKKVHMNASFHANEWITTMVLMRLVNHYLLSLTNINEEGPAAIYEEVELSIVPMVNPDGVNLVLNGPPADIRENLIKINEGSDDFIHWKANIRGIDLNNQFPANWETCRSNKPFKAPASRDFPGEAPLTEPEAVAMAELAGNNKFDRIFAFHTQGEEFYWGYDGKEPAESEILANELEKVSGYQAIRYVNSHAGYKDWFIQEYQRPGFTLELGRGINPLPLSQLPDILKRAEAIFYTALNFQSL